MKSKKKAVINANNCDNSFLCPAKRVCPTGAITQKTKWFILTEKTEIDQETCIGCGKCVNACPHRAIRMK